MRIIFWSAFVSAFIFSAFYLWQHNIFLVITFFLGACALFTLFLIQRSGWVQRFYSSIFKDTILGIGGIIFFITSFGTLYFYNSFDWFGYDVVAHFAITLCFVIMTAMLYELLRLKRKIPDSFETIATSVLTIFIFSFLWEAFEMQGDIWWGTKMFFDPNQETILDFVTDLIADFFGLLVGGILIFKNWTRWNKKWLNGETLKLQNLKIKN